MAPSRPVEVAPWRPSQPGDIGARSIASQQALLRLRAARRHHQAADAGLACHARDDGATMNSTLSNLCLGESIVDRALLDASEPRKHNVCGPDGRKRTRKTTNYNKECFASLDRNASETRK